MTQYTCRGQLRQVRFFVRGVGGLVVRTTIVGIYGRFYLFPLQRVSRGFDMSRVLRLFFSLRVRHRIFLSQTNGIHRVDFASVIGRANGYHL